MHFFVVVCSTTRDKENLQRILKNKEKVIIKNKEI